MRHDRAEAADYAVRYGVERWYDSADSLTNDPGVFLRGTFSTGSDLVIHHVEVEVHLGCVLGFEGSAFEI